MVYVVGGKTPFKIVNTRVHYLILLLIFYSTNLSAKLKRVWLCSLLIGLFVVIRVVDALHEDFAVGNAVGHSPFEKCFDV